MDVGRADPAGPPGPPLEEALARLDRLVDWERRDRSAARFSVEPARDLLRRLGSPERSLRVVHLAGSKGKGSTASLVAQGLLGAGLRVGRYSSPHVERVNERVEIGGREVSDEVLAEGLTRALDALEAGRSESGAAAEATWFDVLTAAAIRILARARVEWAVVEVGLGGRLDSTNALEAELAVVTNVELEHTQVLGDTRAKIAREKAGILKPGAAALTGLPVSGSDGGPDEAAAVLEERAAELGLVLLRPPRIELGGSPGAVGMEERNRELAALALDELGRRGCRGSDGRRLSGGLLDAEAVRRARLPGRMEVFEAGASRPTVVLDGAHVPGSLRALLEELRGRPGLEARPVVVLGLARDKDLGGVLKALLGEADRVLCTSVGTDLHFSAEELARGARRVGLAAETAAVPRDAYLRALEHTGPGGWVLATGSLYLAGALRPLLTSPHEKAEC